MSSFANSKSVQVVAGNISSKFLEVIAPKVSASVIDEMEQEQKETQKQKTADPFYSSPPKTVEIEN